MTSNAGAQSIIDPKKLGFNTKEDAAGDYKRMKNNVMNEIKFIFRPEFLNRIDEILVFHPLTTEQMQKIVGLMCKELVKRAKEQLGIHLTIRDSVKKHIVETGMDKKYGARPLRRAVQNQLEDKLAEAILSGEIGRDMDVVARMSKKKLNLRQRLQIKNILLYNRMNERRTLGGRKMAAVKELLRAETDGTLSFGDYTLDSKTKLDGFDFQGTSTKLRRSKRLQN